MMWFASDWIKANYRYKGWCFWRSMALSWPPIIKNFSNKVLKVYFDCCCKYIIILSLPTNSSLILFKYDASNNEWKQANKTRIKSKSKHTMIGKNKGKKHLQQTKTPARSDPWTQSIILFHLHKVTSFMVWVSFYFYFKKRGACQKTEDLSIWRITFTTEPA